MAEVERRQYKRVSMVTKVTYVKAGVDQYYYSKDISLGGMFISTKKPLPVGAELQLHFTLPGSGRRFEIEGKVVRVVPHQNGRLQDEAGMGILFTDFPEEALPDLTRFLTEN